MSTTQNLHHQAEESREKEHFLDALKLYEEVVIRYQSEKDYPSLVEALGGRCLTYKHLYLLSNDFVFYNLAQHSALSSLEIAQKHNINEKFYRCYFRLGEMQMLIRNYSIAIKYYKNALSNYPQEEAEKGDFQYHLGEAQYRAGKTKLGLQNLLTNQKIIEKYKSTTDSFVYNVWLSGCFISLTKLTKDKKYYTLAPKIIDSDPRLVIRKRQLAQLKVS